MYTPKLRKGFTLIELLIVVTIVSVLAGIGSPVLLKSISIFRFKQDTTVIEGMMNQMRSAALNSRVMPAAENIITSNINCPSGGFDTNFDGICGDITPYRYVFEMMYDSAGDLTLRTYADFTDNSTFNSGQDILIEERAINGDYAFLNIVSLVTSPEAYTQDFNPTSKTYSFAFAPPYGEATMWRHDTVREDLYQVVVRVNFPEFNRIFQILLDRVSGIPAEFNI